MKRAISYLWIACFLTSCTTDAVNETHKEHTDDKIYVYIEDSYNTESNTRVELNDMKQTVWTAGDKIITFGDGYMSEWEFDGNTGDRNGSFTRTGIVYDDPYVESTNYDQHYAVYLSDIEVAQYSDKSPAFVTTLPATQNYKVQSYGLNTNAMLGRSDDGTNYNFINLMGYIRLSLIGDKVVKSITINGNNKEVIAAQVYVNKNGELSLCDNTSTSITLDCGDGVQLTDIPTEFYITVLPQRFSNGIKATINFTDDTVFPKRTSKSITIARNTIQPMRTFDTGSSVIWQNMSISHTGDEISAPLLYGSTALSGYIYWGDNYMSDINTATSYTYDDNEESHTITVKTIDATSVKINSCLGINEINISDF